MRPGEHQQKRWCPGGVARMLAPNDEMTMSRSARLTAGRASTFERRSLLSMPQCPRRRLFTRWLPVASTFCSAKVSCKRVWFFIAKSRTVSSGAELDGVSEDRFSSCGDLGFWAKISRKRVSFFIAKSRNVSSGAELGEVSEDRLSLRGDLGWPTARALGPADAGAMLGCLRVGCPWFQLCELGRKANCRRQALC